MKNKSLMTHKFSEVPHANIPRSSFQRNFGYKNTFSAGDLIPIFWDEALPGDTMNLKLNAFARMATPIFPIMDNLYMDTFYFAVPYRLLWDNWQKFNGEQDDPGDSIDFTIPQVVSHATNGHLEESLYDSLGFPTKVPGLSHSNLLGRAYNLIWNTWFRDQNLQVSITVDTDNGPDTATDYVVQKRGKRHDYFTSALPWPQKPGITPVTLPLGTTAPVYADDMAFDGGDDATNHLNLVDEQGGTLRGLLQGSSRIMGTATASGTGTLYADLTNATAATINELRQAFQIQGLIERDARGGSRYIEVIKAHFGVTSPDARQMRPEYLGGGSQSILVNPIAQTSSTDATTPQGNLAAMATASISGHGFVKSFTEHCILIGLVSVRADLSYQQGLERMHSRLTRYDHMWPSLTGLGEQAILNKEIYAQGTDDAAADAAVFGYQERYGEMRYKNSSICGAFRSNHTTPLDAWHLAQEFGALPTLGATFIADTPPMARVEAVPAEPDFIFDSYTNYTCARPMPMYGTPLTLGKF